MNSSVMEKTGLVLLAGLVGLAASAWADDFNPSLSPLPTIPTIGESRICSSSLGAPLNCGTAVSITVDWAVGFDALTHDFIYFYGVETNTSTDVASWSLLRVRSLALALLTEPASTVKSLASLACRLALRMKVSAVHQSIPRQWCRSAPVPPRTMSLGDLTTRRPARITYYPASKAASCSCTHPFIRSSGSEAVRTAAMAVLRGARAHRDQIPYPSLGTFLYRPTLNRPASFC